MTGTGFDSRRPFILLFLLILTVSCGALFADEGTLRLTFGLYQSEKATSMYRQFTPVLEGIQTKMEEELGCPVDIHLLIFQTYDDGIDALVTGNVDFVRFGPASYVLAKARNDEIQLMAMESKKGKKRFKGYIAVPANSSLKSLEDLKGKRFAFGNHNSTIGRYLAQSELFDAGIRGTDLAHYEYLGRHDIVASRVSVGDFDAGSMKESTFKKSEKGGRLRALHSFDNVTQPWIARAGLEKAVFTSIQRALLNMDDPQLLKELKVSGFLPTSDREYDFVRIGMRQSAQFEQ